MGKKKNVKIKVNIKEFILIIIFLALLELIIMCIDNSNAENDNNQSIAKTEISFDLNSIPEYKDTPYVTIDENKPSFKEEEYTTNQFETYSDLDGLGRCRSCLCKYL